MDKVWLGSYETGVPEDINPDLYPSLNAFFEQICTDFKTRFAFENYNQCLTYQAVYQKAKALSAYLQVVLHLKKGDRVALMLPNCLQYPVAFFGVLMAGGVVVNVNPLSAAPELKHELKDSGALILIAFEFDSILAQCASLALSPDWPIKHLIVTALGDLFSPFRGFLINHWVRFFSKQSTHKNLKSKTLKSVSFKEVLGQGSRVSILNAFRKPAISGDDLALLQYTGGTTGLAKGAMLTHRNLLANIEQTSVWVQSRIPDGLSQKTILGKQVVVVTPLPLYHVFSLTANLLLFFKKGALNRLVTDPRETKTLIRLLKKDSFSAMTGVNTLFKALLNHPDFDKISFKQKPVILSGGMALQATIAKQWHTQTGVPIIEAYGLTEASPAVCINPFNLLERNGSVGLPVPSTVVSIRDLQGAEVGFNQPGILWVKGPQVMHGYWNQPEETRLVLQEGSLSTGDIATIDPQGFIRIVDRAKEMIIVSGFNVYPTEVEHVIAQMPEVLEVAVCAVIEDGVEHVGAFIVKKDLHLTEALVIAYCTERLSAYKVPKIIQFRESLPKSTVGKVLRRLLSNV